MIDLHGHYLPGIDDGARDFEEAVAMCRLAAGDGCEVVVATPHQRHPAWWNDDRTALEELHRRLAAEVADFLDLRLGAEVRVHDGLLGEVARLPAGGLLSLAGSRYLLIELDRLRAVPDPVTVVHELAVAGWYPVLAHPEIIPWLAEDPELMDRLVSLGALTQITAMSVTGEFGPRARDTCELLLEADLVHFVASDAHGGEGHPRPPGLGRAAGAIARGWGGERARRLTRDNPRAVIEDRPLPAASRAAALSEAGSGRP